MKREGSMNSGSYNNKSSPDAPSVQELSRGTAQTAQGRESKRRIIYSESPGEFQEPIRTE